MVQPPTITQQSPKDYIIDPRENIVIQCEAKGKPPPRWVCFPLCHSTKGKHWHSHWASFQVLLIFPVSFVGSLFFLYSYSLFFFENPDSISEFMPFCRCSEIVGRCGKSILVALKAWWQANPSSLGLSIFIKNLDLMISQILPISSEVYKIALSSLGSVTQAFPNGSCKESCMAFYSRERC